MSYDCIHHTFKFYHNAYEGKDFENWFKFFYSKANKILIIYWLSKFNLLLITIERG